MSERWTLKELEQQLEAYKQGSYGNDVIAAALFFKLYGRLPDMDLSEYQASAAMSIADKKLPDSKGR